MGASGVNSCPKQSDTKFCEEFLRNECEYSGGAE